MVGTAAEYRPASSARVSTASEISRASSRRDYAAARARRAAAAARAAAGRQPHRAEAPLAGRAAALCRGTRHRQRQHAEEVRPGLRHPQAAGRDRRADQRRGRARDPAGWLRLPALARRQLCRRPGRHLRLAVADPPLRPAHRRRGAGPGARAQGRRALLRAAARQHDQFRHARGGAASRPFRQPDALLPDPEAEPRGRRAEGHLDPDHRDRGPARQGPAGADRGAAAGPARRC